MGRRFFRDLLILSLSSLFLRGVGVVWNGYLARRTGAGAMGLHSVVLNLYGFAVTLAVAGIGLAVTRLVSEREEVPGWSWYTGAEPLPEAFLKCLR